MRISRMMMKQKKMWVDLKERSINFMLFSPKPKMRNLMMMMVAMKMTVMLSSRWCGDLTGATFLRSVQ